MLDPFDAADDARARRPTVSILSRMDGALERAFGPLADRTGSTPRRLAAWGVATVIAATVCWGVIAQPWRAWTAHAKGGGDIVLPRAAPAGQSAVTTTGPVGAATTVAASIVVDVVGAVEHPGLARLPAGSRAADALVAAGGPAPGADVAQVNLARVLVDGEQVRVPRVGEVVQQIALPAGAGSHGGPSTPIVPIDLNQATVEQLDALPGVGPSTAAAIVQWRTDHGRFRSVDGLLDVPGIGDGKLERLRRFVRV